MTKKRLVVGNWKLHGSVAQIQNFVRELSEWTQTKTLAAEVLVCPPFPYLAHMGAALKEVGVSLGAQDVCEQPGPGAYTGEVSAAMLADLGCSHVIVGHSERREYYGDDARVAAKYAAALEAGLTPILCVGETLAQRDAGKTQRVLDQQLTHVLDTCGVETLAHAVVAYEPVWAIGTGRTATPEQAQEVHAYLRAQIVSKNATIGNEVDLLYGGSVKPDNAAQLFACKDVDGGLIGGASLEASSLCAIASA